MSLCLPVFHHGPPASSQSHRFPVHVLQRGNNRQAVFRADEDYAFYLDTLRMAAREHDFAIHAFALMPNHVHLVGTPKAADSLSRTLQAVGRRYTRYFNAAAGRSGTLWRGASGRRCWIPPNGCCR